jgi:hypothetical protein
MEGVLTKVAEALDPSPGAPQGGAPPSPFVRAFTPVFDGLWGEGRKGRES